MKASLLIVDDEQDMLKLLKRSLEPELVCKVQTASSGEKALQMLTTHAFDLVLADIKMPGMTGLELLDAIKKASVPLRSAAAGSVTAVKSKYCRAANWIRPHGRIRASAASIRTVARVPARHATAGIRFRLTRRVTPTTVANATWGRITRSWKSTTSPNTGSPSRHSRTS